MPTCIFADPFSFYATGINQTVYAEGMWDGYDASDSDEWGTAFGRYDGFGVRLAGTSGNALFKNVDLAEAYLGYGVNVRPGSNPAATYLLGSFHDGTGTGHIHVVGFPTGRIEVRRGNSWTTAPVVTAKNAALQTLASEHIQLRCTLHDTTGVVEVKVNEFTIPELTINGNTRSTGTGAVNIGRLTHGEANGSNPTIFWMQDYWLAPDGWIGDVRLLTSDPTADGAHTDLTPSSGTDRFAMVDDGVSPDEDATFIETDTVGHAASFVHEDADASVDEVLHVLVFSRARKTDGGGATFEHGIRQGSTTTYSGTEHALLGTFRWVYTPFSNTDPTDSNPWTVAKFNSHESVVRRAA